MDSPIASLPFVCRSDGSDGSPPSSFEIRRLAHKTSEMDDHTRLIQARSMLVILLATCKQTETALSAAANALDTDLTDQLRAMIERTEAELVSLVEKIKTLPA